MTEHFIDSLGDFCPIPIIKFQMALKQANSGDTIVLITDHSCTVTSLKQDMRRERLKPKVEEVDNGIWRITLVKP